MKLFLKIEALLQNDKAMLEVANQCDKAYAKGVGHPDWHKPFKLSDTIKMAQNMAGLQAVITTVSIVAEIRGLDTESHFIAILREMAEQSLNEIETKIALRLANATWGAGQRWRVDEKYPHGRPINVFDGLPPAEVAKDMHQIVVAASWLLKKLS